MNTDLIQSLIEDANLPATEKLAMLELVHAYEKVCQEMRLHAMQRPSDYRERRYLNALASTSDEAEQRELYADHIRDLFGIAATAVIMRDLRRQENLLASSLRDLTVELNENLDESSGLLKLLLSAELSDYPKPDIVISEQLGINPRVLPFHYMDAAYRCFVDKRSGQGPLAETKLYIASFIPRRLPDKAHREILEALDEAVTSLRLAEQAGTIFRQAHNHWNLSVISDRFSLSVQENNQEQLRSDVKFFRTTEVALYSAAKRLASTLERLECAGARLAALTTQLAAGVERFSDLETIYVCLSGWHHLEQMADFRKRLPREPGPVLRELDFK
ncbi:MAG TPA: hypothetical protein V6C72_14645, partial [Chroococcales cyanobacterium]